MHIFQASTQDSPSARAARTFPTGGFLDIPNHRWEVILRHPLTSVRFTRALADPRLKVWLAALDLQSSDAENLFNLLLGGSRGYWRAGSRPKTRFRMGIRHCFLGTSYHWLRLEVG